jgi:hypothetical protein
MRGMHVSASDVLVHAFVIPCTLACAHVATELPVSSDKVLSSRASASPTVLHLKLLSVSFLAGRWV